MGRPNFIIAFTLFIGLLLGSCNDRLMPTATDTLRLKVTWTLPPTATQSQPASGTKFPTPTDTRMPSRTPSQTFSLTPTRKATRTPTATLTPYPTLPPSGPYLLYQDPNTDNLVLLGNRGQGRRVIDFPKDGYIRDLPNAVSPGGKWLAFYQGEGRLDRTLSLMSLPDGEIHPVTRLLSQAAQAQVRYGFAYDWSPDGKELAFAGAMDGALSDVYIYRPEDETIRRITDISVDISYIDWSPDGNWILFMNNYMVEGGNEDSDVHIVNDDDRTPKVMDLERGVWPEGVGWISPEVYLMAAGADGGCCRWHNLRSYNVRTMEGTSLWIYPANSIAIDPDRGILMVSIEPLDDIQGSFFIRFDGKRQKFTDYFYWDLIYRGGKNSEFLGFDSVKVYSIDAGGEGKAMTDKPFEKGAVSPDRRWVVLYHSYNKVVGMDLFSETDQFVRTITDQAVSAIRWRPDSQGMFFISDQLYYVSIPSGDPIAIDTCISLDCQYLPDILNSTWIP